MACCATRLVQHRPCIHRPEVHGPKPGTTSSGCTSNSMVAHAEGTHPLPIQSPGVKINLHLRALEWPESHQPADSQPALRLRLACNRRCKLAAIQPSLQLPCSTSGSVAVSCFQLPSCALDAPPSRCATRGSLRAVVSSMTTAWTPSNWRRSFVSHSRTLSTTISRWKRGSQHVIDAPCDDGAFGAVKFVSFSLSLH